MKRTRRRSVPTSQPPSSSYGHGAGVSSHSRNSSTDDEAAASYINPKAVEKLLGMQGRTTRGRPSGAGGNPNYAAVDIKPGSNFSASSEASYIPPAAATSGNSLTKSDSNNDIYNSHVTQRHADYSGRASGAAFDRNSTSSDSNSVRSATHFNNQTRAAQSTSSSQPLAPGYGQQLYPAAAAAHSTAGYVTSQTGAVLQNSEAQAHGGFAQQQQLHNGHSAAHAYAQAQAQRPVQQQQKSRHANYVPVSVGSRQPGTAAVSTAQASTSDTSVTTSRAAAVVNGNHVTPMTSQAAGYAPPYAAYGQSRVRSKSEESLAVIEDNTKPGERPPP